MSLILIYGDRFSGQRELAHALAEELGYRLVTPDVVIERAAAWGASQQELVRVLAESPGLRDRFLRKTHSQWTFLCAALAEEIWQGNVICHGELADLLLHQELPVTRIQVFASVGSRVSAVVQLLRYDEPEAAAFLKFADRARRRWLRVYGVHGEPAPDLLVNLDRIDLREACDTVATFIRMRSTEAVRSADYLFLENFAVAFRIRAALAMDPATRHLELGISSDRGRVSMWGHLPEPEDFKEAQRVAWTVPGVSELELNGEAGGQAEATGGAGDHLPLSWQRVRPTLLATGAGLAAVAFFVLLFFWVGSFVEFSLADSQVIQGVVTDSRCGSRHPQTENAQCVRACVSRGGKYVLDDGKGLYELSSQHDAEKFAARKVRVRGVLEKGAHYVHVQSMELL